jgi:hypothetical protein
VGETLAGAVPGEVCETAALLVSELATNALLHAVSAFEVIVIYPTAAGRVRLEVADGDPTAPTPLRPPPTVPHGRGLQLVAMLSEHWGAEEAKVGGKLVWFELAVSAEAVPGDRRSTKARTPRDVRRGPSMLGRAPHPLCPLPRYPLQTALYFLNRTAPPGRANTTIPV